jgi:hypothetical protein
MENFLKIFVTLSDIVISRKIFMVFWKFMKYYVEKPLHEQVFIQVLPEVLGSGAKNQCVTIVLR